MMNAKQYWLFGALAVAGVLGGLAYWNFWGCTESCPIDASWKWSMARGGLIGLCLAGIFSSYLPGKKKNESHGENQNH